MISKLLQFTIKNYYKIKEHIGKRIRFIRPPKVPMMTVSKELPNLSKICNECPEPHTYLRHYPKDLLNPKDRQISTETKDNE